MTGPASPRPRIICLLCPGAGGTAGGIGQFAANLLAALARSDPSLRLELVDTRGSGPLALAPLYFAHALARLTVLAISGRLGLIHINLSSHGSTLRKFFVVVLARLLRTPFILHLHGSRFDHFYRGLPPPLRRPVRWMFSRACRVVVLGRAWRDLVIDELDCPSERVEIIANGVAAPPGRVASAGRVINLLFLGRLSARKGMPELLAALARPSVAVLPWRATIAGDGNLAHYRAEAARLGLAEKIVFPGWCDRTVTDRLLGEAAVLVHPSHAEGLPLAVLEGLAHRLAVVTTTVGALPEFLEHGRSALLVPPGDVGALAAALGAVIADAMLRARLGTAGRRVFLRHFDITVTARRFADLYRRLASPAAESWPVGTTPGGPP